MSYVSFKKKTITFLNTAGDAPAREITMMKKEKENKPCYNMGENCQQVLLIEAYFIQCWCVVVLLVNICLSNHPFFLLGVGHRGRGWGLFTKERRGKNRVFCYCPIRG